MEVNFGRSRPFSLGVEEEFQLVSPESFERLLSALRLHIRIESPGPTERG